MKGVITGSVGFFFCILVCVKVKEITLNDIKTSVVWVEFNLAAILRPQSRFAFVQTACFIIGRYFFIGWTLTHLLCFTESPSSSWYFCLFPQVFDVRPSHGNASRDVTVVECERRKLFSVIVYPLVAHQSIILEVYRRMQVKNSEQVFRKCGTVQIFEKQ